MLMLPVPHAVELRRIAPHETPPSVSAVTARCLRESGLPGSTDASEWLRVIVFLDVLFVGPQVAFARTCPIEEICVNSSFSADFHYSNSLLRDYSIIYDSLT